MVITGEEVYTGDIHARAGTTKTTLTVQGAYANPEMENQIEHLWNQLHDLIDSTLQGLPRAQSAPPPNTSWAPNTVAVPAAAPLIANGVELVEAAHSRVNALIEALIEGRLSQVKIYQELCLIAQELEQFHRGAALLRQAEVGG